jgi:cytidylate kinase
MRRFYDVATDDPALYHLLIDSTAFSFDVCVELIVRASQALNTGIASRLSASR